MYKLLKYFIIASFALLLGACDSNNGTSFSDGGGLTGDGGKNSASYAGRYYGYLNVRYTGGGTDGADNFETDITVNKNGTVRIIVDDQTITGVINGNEVQAVLKLSRSKNGVKCNGEVLIKANIVGKVLSGPVNGDATCRLLTAKRTATLSGTVNATKR